MYVFLDFDGVLRRLSSDPSRFDSDCLACFEAAVRPLPDIKVVISSTWRLVKSLKELQGMFSAEISGLIVGATPEHFSQSAHTRYDEIMAYMKTHNLHNEGWLAIDDDPDHFPSHAPLLLTSPDVGFDQSCTMKLWEYAAKEMGE